jgi:hypothetical protein
MVRLHSMTVEQKAIAAIVTFLIWFVIIVLPEAILSPLGRLLVVIAGAHFTSRIWGQEKRVAGVWKTALRAWRWIDSKFD